MIPPQDKAELENLALTAGHPQDVVNGESAQMAELRRLVDYLKGDRDYLLEVMRVRNDMVDGFRELHDAQKLIIEKQRVRIEELQARINVVDGSVIPREQISGGDARAQKTPVIDSTDEAKVPPPPSLVSPPIQLPRLTAAEHNAFPKGRYTR